MALYDEQEANPYRQGESYFADGFTKLELFLICNPFDMFVSEWNHFITFENLKDDLSRGNT